MKGNESIIVKRIVDAVMTVLLFCLMAYQVTGEALHEWIGVIMTLTVIVHQILNRKWYGALLKGKYNPIRITMTVINLLLVARFLLTAFCGMSMSGYAVPFLYGMAPVSFVRRMHLSMSHWSFVLMGLHLGLHIRMIFAGVRPDKKAKLVVTTGFTILAGIGLWLFFRNNMPDYLFFRVPFAFLDYDKAGALVILENVLMLGFWGVLGHQFSLLLTSINNKSGEKSRNSLIPVVVIMASVIIGLLLNAAFSESRQETQGSETAGWNSAQQGTAEAPAEAAVETETGNTAENTADKREVRIEDGFVLISGGTFMMGSPESENWRIEDELQHEVTLAGFYMDPFESTQKDYKRIMGSNPSSFPGDELPVENISWLDAIQFANKKSEDAGLTPAYTITDNTVVWDRSANGYRLPTEAEWEYACRAGTITPFNTEHSLDADAANFYGHYPYEIEENYFDNSVLEARPGEYRGQTIQVGSFEPNVWGLYDCHGNVNEWCWDFYGAYDTNDAGNPAGVETGTRHVYRGGGWNDFAKNMRSAYRAAGQADMKSYNLGVRLVRNADHNTNGVLTVSAGIPEASDGSRVLIAYFSWGGNTRGIANEIQKQTGADLFEITPLKPYSSDYNTVLMEAQEDQHRQARPELADHVENMEDYDIILLGYPNWWASIPMPIASFLEEYDFSGKQIIPFCSHGGGRFGQSLTAIAKLAPDANMGEGLSVHYSGGSSLPEDIADWLKTNGIEAR